MIAATMRIHNQLYRSVEPAEKVLKATMQYQPSTEVATQESQAIGSGCPMKTIAKASRMH